VTYLLYNKMMFDCWLIVLQALDLLMVVHRFRMMRGRRFRFPPLMSVCLTYLDSTFTQHTSTVSVS